MKKIYILVGIFILVVIIVSVLGSILVTGDQEIKKEKDILLVQENQEKYFTSYGYDIDNPNIIINPYGNSPLTAIIMFETDDYVAVDISIKSKDGKSDINYSFEKDKYHLIPIYGLYANYNNTVVLRAASDESIINIKTDGLPSDFIIDNSIQKANNFTFINTNYPYAIDQSGEVRWFLNDHYYGNITFLDDSKIVIGSNKLTEDGQAISLYKMNFLGKIYNEYIPASPYYGTSAIYDDNILILSDKIYEIDMQTGGVVKEYIKNDGYDSLFVNDGKIIVGKDSDYYQLDDEELIKIDYSFDIYINHNFYNNTSNYKLIKGCRFGTLNETDMYKENISLLGYESNMPDDILIDMDVNRIRVINNSSSKEIYFILDKFLDKRIYLVEDIKYINLTGLKGKYTVYLKISDDIYKTNYYIEV